MKVKINLNTKEDVDKFVKITSSIDKNVTLEDDCTFIINAKSILGVLYSVEWDRIYCVCEDDICKKIKEFIE